MSVPLALATLASLLALGVAATPAAAEEKGELLYNGIRLPEVWPPRLKEFADDPVKPLYLAAPPSIIPIDVGRQLFVDDFLIDSTTLARTYHQAEYHPATPVIKPDQPWEMLGDRPMATVFSDGVWFDPKDRLFKMWYYAGHGGGATCYATSKDGIRWEKPKLDVAPGTNIVYKGARDSGTVWLDQETTDPEQRWKMALYADGILRLFRSADGIHWTKMADGGKTGDRSTFFYNPFRKRWVYSLRAGWRGRSRDYWETSDFFSFSQAAREKGEVVPWTAADNADPRREDMNVPAQLYNLDCAAYESVLVGLFSIWRGDYRFNQTTEKAKELFTLGRPKQNSVCIGFSRDGFYWDRPGRRPFCPTSEEKGAWNWGNMQSLSDVCLVVGDKLYFYVSGRAGKSFPGSGFCDAGGSTGLALLRRDGFASMDAGSEEGVLTTRPVTFTGKHLFVNAAAAQGELRVEVLDEAGKPIAPFTSANCSPLRANKTLVAVTWKRAKDLSALAGKPVRFRFTLKNGSLYAFWVSPEKSGASHGYVAGGGPGFTGPTDTVGDKALAGR